MKKNMYKKSIISLIILLIINIFSISLFSNINIAKAATAPYFELSAIQGQGDGSDEFYVGRCFRVNIYLNTGGTNTNASDVEVNYDNTKAQVVQSNCSTAATVIYADGLYDTYPSQGNSVSSGKIYLSAYNDPGNNTNTSNGLYGHFFLKVLDVDSSFDLTFEYTQDLTTDTNLAESGGNGSDILESVVDLTLKLLEDSDTPSINTQSPANSATGVSVSSNVTFNAYDAMSGIDSGTIAVTMKEDGGGYIAQTESIGSVQSTNQTRYYQYPVTVNPNSAVKTNGGYYEYDTTYYVSATFSDLASSAHEYSTSWSFTTEGDSNAPYISNLSPADSSSNISTSTNITFRVKDYKSNGGTIPGVGVDSSSIVITVDGSSSATTTYNCAHAQVTCNTDNINNILVTIDPAVNFSENETVTIEIDASDSNSPANDMITGSYTFETADSGAPLITSLSPTANSFGNDTDTNVSFNLTDSGAGVAIETFQVYLNDSLYTFASDEVTIEGDSSDYSITIDPETDFTDNTAVSVRVVVRDQAPSLNYIDPNPYLYSFIVGLSTTTTSTTESCPSTSCPSCPSCPTQSSGGNCVGGNSYIYVEVEKEVDCKPCPNVPTLSCPSIPTAEKPTPIIDNSKTQTTQTNNIIQKQDNNKNISNTATTTKDNNNIIANTREFTITKMQPEYSGLLNKTSIKQKIQISPAHISVYALIILICLALLFFSARTVTSMVGLMSVLLLSLFGLTNGFLKPSVLFSPKNTVVSVSKADLDKPENPNDIFNQLSIKASSTLKDVTLKVYDPISDQYLSNINLSIGNLLTSTNDEGIAFFGEIDGNNKVKVYSSNDDQPIYIELSDINDNTIHINTALQETLNEIAKSQKQRKYTQTYKEMDEEIKKIVSSSEFVARQNTTLIDLLKKFTIVETRFEPNYLILNNYKSVTANKKYDNVAKVNLVYSGFNKNKELVTTKEPWYFYKSQNGWKVIMN